MPRGSAANFFSNQMTRAVCCSRTSTTLAICNNGRRKRLTTVLICLPLGLITLILLCVFTSMSESAALTSKASSTEKFTYSSYSNHNPIFNYTGEYPLNPYPHPKSPKVFLKHNGESGMINPALYENYDAAEEQERQLKHLELQKASEERGSSAYDHENYENNYDDYNSGYSNDDYNNEKNGRALSIPAPAAASDAAKKSTPLTSSKLPDKHWMEFLVDQTTFPYVPPAQFQYQQPPVSKPAPSLNYSRSTPHSSKTNFIFPSSDNKFFSKQDQIATAAASSSPTYFYPYSSYSEEDLENVADFDDHHSKYFIKTKPKLPSAKSGFDSLFSGNIKRAIPSPSQSPRPTSNHYFGQDDVVEHIVPYSPAKSPPPVQIHSDEYDEDIEDETNDANDSKDTSSSINNETVKNKGFYENQSLSVEEEDEDADLHSDVIPNPNPTATTITTTTETESDKNNVSNPTTTPTTTTAPPSADLSSSASIISDFSSSTTANNLITDVTSKYGTTDATSIPGMPGIDYPILDEVPYTGFDCNKQRYKGFFADIDTKCQAWHYCDFTDGHSTFLCPNGTLFSQVLLTCDWWFNVDCKQAQQLYVLNERLYRYIKPPKPSFPEDYSGPQVDRWLIEQLQLGTYPKMKKKSKDKPTEPSTN